MAAKIALSSSLNAKLPFSSKIPSHSCCSPRKSIAHQFRINANLGGDGELKKGGKKKFITREEEPQQYWQTAGEREGENPMKTPIPYIIIFGVCLWCIKLANKFQKLSV
ncbi:hypothetical protein Nepgr_012822 [Nepenthes gracilis]|uniref:Uncharacterized protein n=1 Tax=Nepenthes gracilis TaxID=150966 RepID=A0AAD3XNQ4_NEPGR|nr:hypothetical protein Nepgr_012822 [Nepenthes gracilis]